MSWIDRIEGEFSSAHKLYNYKGKCANVHGHNWKVIVKVKSKVLDESGMICDFKDLKLTLNEVLEELDHKYINKDVKYFEISNPTSENLAKYICDRFIEKIQLNVKNLEFINQNMLIYSVRVFENEKCYSEYFND